MVQREGGGPPVAPPWRDLALNCWQVYDHWKNEGLARSRINAFNMTANIAILGPYVVAVLWTFSS